MFGRCVYFPDIPNKHVDIPNIHILMLGSLAGYVGNLLSTLGSKLFFTYN